LLDDSAAIDDDKGLLGASKSKKPSQRK
jgi:hypothetical protein